MNVSELETTNRNLYSKAEQKLIVNDTYALFSSGLNHFWFFLARDKWSIVVE